MSAPIITDWIVQPEADGARPSRSGTFVVYVTVALNGGPAPKSVDDAVGELQAVAQVEWSYGRKPSSLRAVGVDIVDCGNACLNLVGYHRAEGADIDREAVKRAEGLLVGHLGDTLTSITASVAAATQERVVTEWENTADGACGSCFGSGEGRYDGSRCTACWGSGNAHVPDDDDEGHYPDTSDLFP